MLDSVNLTVKFPFDAGYNSTSAKEEDSASQ